MRWDNAFKILDQKTLETIAADFGTPVCAFNAETLKNRCLEVERVMKSVSLFFPYKSCGIFGVRKRFNQFRIGADVASPLEFEMALRAGVVPDRIILNQPLQDSDVLQKAIEMGVTVVAESPVAVGAIAKITGHGLIARVLLRVNPGVGVPVWSRFGMHIHGKELFEALQLARDSEGVELLGLHCHLGTNLNDLEIYREAAEIIVGNWYEIEKAYGQKMKVWNIGGGFATPTSEPLISPPGSWSPASPEEILGTIKQCLAKHNLSNRVDLWAEPGRLLAEDSAVLISRIIEVKNGLSGPMAVCDGGVNLVPTAGAIRHPIRLLAEYDQQQLREVELYGPLCMQSDILGVGVPLPIDCKAGDLLVIGNVGAYDQSFSFSFITGRCPVVIAEYGRIVPIRKGDTIDSIMASELCL